MEILTSDIDAAVRAHSDEEKTPEQTLLSHSVKNASNNSSELEELKNSIENEISLDIAMHSDTNWITSILTMGIVIGITLCERKK